MGQQGSGKVGLRRLLLHPQGLQKGELLAPEMRNALSETRRDDRHHIYVAVVKNACRSNRLRRAQAPARLCGNRRHRPTAGGCNHRWRSQPPGSAQAPGTAGNQQDSPQQGIEKGKEETDYRQLLTDGHASATNATQNSGLTRGDKHFSYNLLLKIATFFLFLHTLCPFIRHYIYSHRKS